MAKNFHLLNAWTHNDTKSSMICLLFSTLIQSSGFRLRLLLLLTKERTRERKRETEDLAKRERNLPITILILFIKTNKYPFSSSKCAKGNQIPPIIRQSNISGLVYMNRNVCIFFGHCSVECTNQFPIISKTKTEGGQIS